MDFKNDSKKKVLLIRCANLIVIENLIIYLNNKYKREKFNIYMLIQKSSINLFQEKYPFINYIEKDDKCFNYLSFWKNKRNRKILKQIKFDEIYIPSSYKNFVDMEEILMIASKINCKKYCLFNSDGVIIEKKLRFIIIFIKKYSNYILYFLKVLFAYIIIFFLYTCMYPYNLLKKKLKSY